MSKATTRIKITKHVFEQMLIAKHSIESLTASTVEERTDLDEFGDWIYTTLTLYYADGEHCATWMGGEGWEFVDENVTKYHESGVRLTDCCGAFSTYHLDEMGHEFLCCKKCWNEVPVGLGDGLERNTDNE